MWGAGPVPHPRRVQALIRVCGRLVRCALSTTLPWAMDDVLRDLVARALAEDLGEGDLTSESVVPSDAQARARVVQKQPGVVFGLEAAAEAFAQAGADA